MQIKQALKFAAKKINNLDAEVLLYNLLNKNKEFLYTHPEYKLDKNNLNKFKKYISRRKNGEPVAYIVKNKNFFSLNFYVNKNVLIPRPETEILVEECLKICRDATCCVSNILYICTGSGCIIISLAYNLKNKKIKYIATDISKKILDVARKNAKKYKLNINFIKSNLLKNIYPAFGNVKDYILIANLPYLPDKIDELTRTVLAYEPKKALYSGKNGLDLYRKLFLEITKLKNKPKYILIEICNNHAEKIIKIIKNNLKNYKIKIKPDLAGLNRALICHKTNY